MQIRNFLKPFLNAAVESDTEAKKSSMSNIEPQTKNQKKKKKIADTFYKE
jgi:hypothetical protein